MTGSGAEGAAPKRRPALPSRSRRYGVGKEIGGAVYLHRHYEHILGEPVHQAKEHIPTDFAYTVVKYQLASGVVSFIHSPDFDAAPEPTVGDLWTVRPDGSARFSRQPTGPFLYHHKWLFVADDYQGFDVEESRERSRTWLSLADVDARRIGRKSYWMTNVLTRL